MIESRSVWPMQDIKTLKLLDIFNGLCSYRLHRRQGMKKEKKVENCINNLGKCQIRISPHFARVGGWMRSSQKRNLKKKKKVLGM